MIRGITVLAIALLAAALAGCAFPSVTVNTHASAASETRQVHGFDRVQVDGTGTLFITQGAAEALTIRAASDVLPRLRSDVQDGLLLLGPQPGLSINSSVPIRYDLTIQRLSSVVLTGAAAAQADGLRTDQLALDISGAGRIGLTGLTTGALTVRITGTGKVTAAGQAPEQTVSITGAGDYAGSNLASQRATVDLSGAGSAELRVSDQLRATVSGVGRVTYVGSPAVEQHMSGVGSVTRSG
jgi:hypothetical protein